MTPSDGLFEFVKAREGCKSKAYQDDGGVWTIGVGHTGPEVIAGLINTDDRIRSDFFKDLSTAVNCVNGRVQVPLTQHEFDALVDFTFNLGCGNFCNSTLLRKLNAKDYQGAHDEFVKWNKCGGRVLNGLTVRRDLEAEMFNTDVVNT